MYKWKNLQPVVEKNEKCSILFETSSKAFIPSVNIVLNIAVKNRFTGKSKKIKLRGKTNGKNKNEIYYDVEFNQFGSVIISFDSYEVLDWFGIFSLKSRRERKYINISGIKTCKCRGKTKYKKIYNWGGLLFYIWIGRWSVRNLSDKRI